MSFSALAIVLVISVLLLWCVLECRKPRGFPPGPPWLPLLGCLPLVHRLRTRHRYLHSALEKLAEIYGPVLGVKLGQQRFVVVSGHELVKRVLMREEFNGRPDGFFFRVRSFGARKGVLFTEGATWAHNRRLTMKHLRAFGFGQPSMQEHLLREAGELVKNLEERGRSGRAVAMHSAFDVPVLNALWTIIAGHGFSYEDPRLRGVLQAVHDAFRISDTLGGTVSQIPFLRHVIPELSGYNDLMSVLRKLWGFIGDEVEEHERRMRSEDRKPQDLIDAFLREMISAEEDPKIEAFDREDILVLCLDLFLAGSKTTTDALAITFAFLAHRPDWLKTLQEDLDAVVGRDRDPVLEDAALLPRLEAFLAESQRTLILTPLGVPHSTTSSVSLEGYEIPKDTTILLNFHSAHNDESRWKNPQEFKPERFLDQDGRFNRQNDFMQFGLGKRRCLGETLARSSFFLFFTHVIHHFDLGISEEHGKPCLEGTDGFVISPKPYHLILTPRSSPTNNFHLVE